MSLFELAKQFVCSVIAVAMGLTVSVVKGLLPLRPEWLERVELLEAHFRRLSAGPPAGARPALAGARPPAAPAEGRPEQGSGFPFAEIDGFLAAYERLWEFTQSLRKEQIFFEDDLRQRVQKEWSVDTLLAYMRAAERSLNDQATSVQAEAVALITAARRNGSGKA